MTSRGTNYGQVSSYNSTHSRVFTSTLLRNYPDLRMDFHSGNYKCNYPPASECVAGTQPEHS